MTVNNHCKLISKVLRLIIKSVMWKKDISKYCVFSKFFYFTAFSFSTETEKHANKSSWPWCGKSDCKGKKGGGGGGSLHKFTFDQLLTTELLLQTNDPKF